MSKATLIERLNILQQQIDAARAEMIVAINNHLEQPAKEYNLLLELAYERLDCRSEDRELELDPCDFLDALKELED